MQVLLYYIREECGIWQTPELLSRTACGDRNHAEAFGVDETTVICMSRTSGLMRTLGRVQAACFTLSTCMHIIARPCSGPCLGLGQTPLDCHPWVHPRNCNMPMHAFVTVE